MFESISKADLVGAAISVVQMLRQAARNAA